MWTPTTRRQHSRAGQRYGSDLTDAEWAILSPFLPPEAGCGLERAYPMREVVNAICYVLRGGIAWRLMPETFPPWGTVYRWFARVRDDGTWETINHLVMRDRERVGREASPTAAVPAAAPRRGRADRRRQLPPAPTRQPRARSHARTTHPSDRLRTASSGPATQGQERRSNQRLITTPTGEFYSGTNGGNPTGVDTDIQDRDGAGPLLHASRPRWPFVELAFADAGYQGPRVAAASPIRIEIVRKPKGQVSFAVHARRWVVERFFAWINRNRRLAKDVEATIASAEAFLYAASAILLLRRIAR